MRYNDNNGTTSPLKTSARSAANTTRRLTQPTKLGGGLGWYELYHARLRAPVGLIGALQFQKPENGMVSLSFEGVNRMIIQTELTSINRVCLVYALKTLRLEWERAAEAESLLIAKAPVGLLLADLVIAAGLTPQEQQIALGDRLFSELNGIVLPISELTGGSGRG